MESFAVWFWANFMVTPLCAAPNGVFGALYVVGFSIAAFVLGCFVATLTMGGNSEDAPPAAWLGFLIIWVATAAAFLWLGTRAAAWLTDTALDAWRAFADSYGGPLAVFGVACWAVGFLCCLLCRARAWRVPAVDRA